MHFGMPAFAKASSNDRNYSMLQRNATAFWNIHPAIKKFKGGAVDEDLKHLLTSLLSQDLNIRPVSIEQVIGHPYFAKESDLIDASTN